MNALAEAGPSSDSRLKRKRSADIGSSRGKKPRTFLEHRKKKTKKPNDWHLRRKDVPKEAESTKVDQPPLTLS